MKRLFLTSIKIDLLASLISSDPCRLKVVFIPTAADPYEDKWFVEADRKKLNELGFKFIELDLKDKTKENLELILQDANILYVAGGNSFYLLQKMRESGLDKILPDLVDNGLLYSGSSAGAVVTGPTIEPVSLLDDPLKAPELKSFDGLNLVNFLVLPHYGNKKYSEKHQNIIKNYSNKGFDLVPITDEQSIIAEGDNYKIV